MYELVYIILADCWEHADSYIRKNDLASENPVYFRCPQDIDFNLLRDKALDITDIRMESAIIQHEIENRIQRGVPFTINRMSYEDM